MFTDLNPLDRPTAILEIVIMLLGAAIIGFLVAWMARRPKSAPQPEQKAAPSNQKGQQGKADKALEALKSEKAALEEALATVKGEKAELEKELTAAKAVKPDTEVGKAQPGAEVVELQQSVELLRNEKTELEKALALAKEDQVRLQAAILTNNELAQTIADLKATVQKFETDVEAQKAAHAAELERIQAAMQQTGAQQDSAGPHPAEAELARIRESYAALEVEAARAKELGVEVQGLRKEIEGLKAQGAATESDMRVRELERSLREKQLEAFNLQAELVKARTAKPSEAAASPEGGSKEMEWLRREKEDLERDVKDLEAQIDKLERENSELRNSARDKNSAGLALDKVTKERDRLKAELDKLRRELEATALPADLDFTHLGTATEADKQELTRINGIGPVVEGKLNRLGIFTFAQLSRLSETDMDRIDQALGLFPGRVKREGWVEQAGRLAGG